MSKSQLMLNFSLAKNKTRRILTKICRLHKKQKLIVSLTSYPARITYVSQVIRSLFAQTTLPDLVVLYLSTDQFPNKELDLPKDLLQCRSFDFEIHWVKDDLKSHKKYLYVFKEYPDDIIVTVDDDIICRFTLLEELLQGYHNHPACIIALRAHAITFTNQMIIRPYSEWISEVGIYKPELCNIESFQLFATSGAGLLFPPHSLPDIAFDQEVIKRTCLNADDIWLKTMTTLSGFQTVTVSGWQGVTCIEGSQETSLWVTNRQGGNDKALSLIRDYCEQELGVNSFDLLFLDKEINCRL